MKCQKCGRTIEQGATYCEHCGHKVVHKKENLQQSEVRKNVFGLLAMYTFLFTLMLFTLLPKVLSLLHLPITWMTPFNYIGYALAIIFEIIAIVICKKDKSINMQTAGVNYGSAAMVFSIFMIIAKLARVY